MRYIFLLGLISLTSFANAQTFNENIRLNQIGFYPQAEKIAVVQGSDIISDFYVLSTNQSDTFFVGKLTAPIQSLYSTIKTSKADFSSLTRPGSYIISIPTLGYSHTFRIDKNILSEVSKGTMKAFYYMRSSMSLEPAYSGKWHRSLGHPDTSVLIHPSASSSSRPSGTILHSPGGWYDAGDYNKYIVNSGITMATLLSAYEDYSAYFKNIQVNIPESSNALPDILDEVVYNLRWMMTMQDPSDGGVYHKCTNAKFDDMVMPGMTKEPRYLVQKSTAASLDFTAVMAQAARIFKNFNKQLPGLSDSCLKYAERSWTWSLAHPHIIYDQDKINQTFQPAISTGSYRDGNTSDEFFWASCELYSTTKDVKYLKQLDNIEKVKMVLPTWNNVAMLGVYSILKIKDELPEAYSEKKRIMKATVITLADKYVNHAHKSIFATAMGSEKSDFVWGSNSNAANQGILLLYAFHYTREKKYFDAANTNADYLLGRNATGYSFVTGFGAKTPMHPHHRPSIADGIVEPVPGLLVGGPNPFMQDKCIYKSTEVENAYTDDDCSYASNEIAINWNAPAVYLFNAIQAFMKEQRIDDKTETLITTKRKS